MTDTADTSHLNCQTPIANFQHHRWDIMDRAIQAEADGAVLNASVFGCFPLADISCVGLSAIIVCDGDTAGGAALLDELLG